MLFTERDAILFEMQELKEVGRLDHDMYFELRKHRNQRYSELQDRLRIIDERDGVPKETFVAPPVPQQVTPQIIVQKPAIHPEHRTLKDLFKELPQPKSAHMSTSELRVDRIKMEETEPIKKKQRTRHEFPTPVETTEAIEQYLKLQTRPVLARDIKNYIEAKYHIQWANFANVIDRAIQMSPFIKVDATIPRKRKYSYKHG